MENATHDQDKFDFEEWYKRLFLQRTMAFHGSDDARWANIHERVPRGDMIRAAKMLNIVDFIVWWDFDKWNAWEIYVDQEFKEGTSE